MTELKEVEAELVERSGRQSPDTHIWGDHSLDLWEPFIVSKDQIDAEAERLSLIAAPNNGVRRTYFVHPRAEEGTLSFTPGISCSLDVLNPGEETAFVRQNASIIDFPIKGGGKVAMGIQTFGMECYDLLTVPAMCVHKYINDTDSVQVRLRYSNAPLLERLKVHWLDEDPPLPGAEDDEATEGAEEAGEEAPKSPYGTFQLTEDGAYLKPYEELINPQPIEVKPHHWPWDKVKEELDKLAALGSKYKGRRLYLLYDPITGRTNGTNPNFFSCITIRPAGIVDRPHRHASAAINYYFGGEGHSVVQGKRYDWKAGDLMLSAPGWAIHNHASDVGPVYEMTIQDMPFMINADSLLWQEDLKGAISLLGSQPGFETNREKVA
ncbi:MAG: AraC family ligand binding domain-containing protein [Alphaproteobacteria bacterium]|nr:AraC family ligand binding domain-containing protein [Alphaproteobacteria bacterium]